MRGSLDFPDLPEYPSSSSRLQVWMALLAVAVLLVAIFIGFMSYHGQVEMVTGLVDQTYIKHVGEDGDRFFVVIHRDNGTQEVFENVDTVFWSKWNSADINAKIKVGDRVKVKAVGFRWPLFSVFRNIITVEKTGGK